MDTTKKSIAVIMTVHNRKSTTLECLKHLFQCKVPQGVSITVYLMDDGSTDGTSDAVSKEFPRVVILQGNGHLYWNQGMRKCWKEALKHHHDYYLWLNDDTMIFNNTISELLDVYQQVASTSIIVGQLCSTKDPLQKTYGGRLNNEVLMPSGNIEKCDEMCGNVVLVPHKVVEKIGILCRFYSHKWGDYDYSSLANKNNIGIYTTRCFVGTCDVHVGYPKCFNPNVPLKERLSHFFSPLGGTPLEYALFKFRTCKLKNALLGATLGNYNHFKRCLFPQKFNN